MQDFMIRDVLEGITVAATLILIAYSPIFRALGKRIMHGRIPPDGVPLAVDDERVEQLSGEVASLRRELDATHERLDFAERMLAQSRERGALPQPRNG
jgi:hypothetical protein